MATFQIKSEDFIVTVSNKGAEVISVKQVVSGEEFIWDANPSIWNRHAPVLFPIVGKVIDNKYISNGESFSMGQHGFARDMEFELIEIYTDVIRLMLQSSEETREKYPFDFKLFVEYKITGTSLTTQYTILNTDTISVPFAIGAHPGFLLPVENFERYSIHFNTKEIGLKKHLIKDGYLTGETELLPLIEDMTLLLNKDIFEKDALVFKQLSSNEISLKHLDSNWQVKMKFEGFPFFGIWSKHPNQKFICLEPWAGITDSLGFKGDFSQKEGVHNLMPNEQKSYQYEIAFKGIN